MAENKKSFVLYADYIHTIKKMPKEKIGELFLTILEYVNDENPIVDDLMVDLVFEPIKLQLKRDLVRWGKFKEKQAENGKLGGRPQKPKPLNENPKNPSLLDESQKSLNVTDTVNDNVNVTDTVNDNVKNINIPAKKKFSRASEIKTIFENYFFEINKEKYYWTAKDAGSVNPIVNKLRFKIQEKSSEKKEVTDEEIVTSFSYLLKIITDDWLKSHLSMPIINSKFNEIIANKNGNKPKANSPESYASLNSAIDEYFDSRERRAK